MRHAAGRPALAALALLAAALAGCGAGTGEAGPAFDGDLDARVVKAGETPGEGEGPPAVTTRFFVDEAEWRAEWPPGQAEPEPVDFARQAVLELRWEPVPTSGHRVEFQAADWTEEGGYRALVRLLSPDDGCVVGTAIAAPYAWVAVDRVGTVREDTPVQVESTEGRGPPCG